MYERKWPDGLLIRELTQEEYDLWVEPNQKTVFQSMTFFPHNHLEGAEKERTDALRAEIRDAMKRIRLGAFYDGQFAGWHFGRAESAHTYQMSNSAVLPEFRRKKIYERLLESTMEYTRDLGFLELMSGHHPTNNAVIIPKLKKGFFVSGTELTSQVGLVIRLVYFHSPLARKVYEFRSGYTFPDDELKGIFQL